MSNKTKLDSLIGELMNARNNDFQVKSSDALWLCHSVIPIFAYEKTVLDINPPVQICGDIHGQLSDLVRCLQIGGLPPFARWLFLGDYVDRGPKSVEVMCLLFALKIRYPNQIFLIRGNHECAEMTEIFGFAIECVKKLQSACWTAFCEAFDLMPLAAIVNKDYLCIHGGISSQLEKVQQIRDIKRPLTIPQSGFITDLLWSDPSKELVAASKDYAPSTRGSTYLWSSAPAKRFLKANNLKFIVRGHQMCMEGYDYPFFPDKFVITMFTASNYHENLNNKAAFMAIDQIGNYEIKVLASSNSTASSGPPRSGSKGLLPISPRKPPSTGQKGPLALSGGRNKSLSIGGSLYSAISSSSPSLISSHNNNNNNNNYTPSNASLSLCSSPPSSPTASASNGATTARARPRPGSSLKQRVDFKNRTPLRHSYSAKNV